jgi:hypothetical protein
VDGIIDSLGMNPSISIYPSKVDFWLAAVLISAPLFVIGLGIYLILMIGAAGWICLVSGLFTAALIAGLAIPCRYTLTENFLMIQCGFLKEEINYGKIKSVSLSSNPLSAPALSLSRVKVDLESSFRLISPKNREVFIQELENKTKKLGQQGAASNHLPRGAG